MPVDGNLQGSTRSTGHMDRDTATPTGGTIPGSNADTWSAHHHQHAAPSTYEYPFVWDAGAEAAGPFCTDVDGNVLLDFTSHVAAAPLGYKNSLITDRLDGFDLDGLDPLKIAGQDFYAGWGSDVSDPDFPGPTQLLERITEITEQYGMDTVFLSNSGAEAVENAIKICYDDRDAHRGVTCNGAFHGRTLGALSLNRSKTVHRRGFPEIPGVIAIPYCTCETITRCECGWRTDGPGGNILADKLHPSRGVIDAEEVAYVILEPIQGEGGYRAPNTVYLNELQDLCDQYNIRLICDEIQSGLGRTGKMWASDHTPLDPDVITSAKGLRVGATIASEDVFPDTNGRLSSTWGAGDLLNSLYGAVTIDAIVEENLVQNAAEQGRALQSRLRDLDKDCIEDIRGLGLMIGVEFDTKQRRDAVVTDAFSRGLLTLGCGHKTLRLLPPLDVRDRELDIAVEILAETIDATA